MPFVITGIRIKNLSFGAVDPGGKGCQMARIRNRVITKGPAGDFQNYLDYLENRYSELEELHRDWSEVSDPDKVEFAEEWGMVKVMLARLEQSIRQYGVPAAYRERYPGYESASAGMSRWWPTCGSAGMTRYKS